MRYVDGSIPISHEILIIEVFEQPDFCLPSRVLRMGVLPNHRGRLLLAYAGRTEACAPLAGLCHDEKEAAALDAVAERPRHTVAQFFRRGGAGCPCSGGQDRAYPAVSGACVRHGLPLWA
jgi:hypothetical protein